MVLVLVCCVAEHDPFCVDSTRIALSCSPLILVFVCSSPNVTLVVIEAVMSDTTRSCWRPVRPLETPNTSTTRLTRRPRTPDTSGWTWSWQVCHPCPSCLVKLRLMSATIRSAAQVSQLLQFERTSVRLAIRPEVLYRERHPQKRFHGRWHLSVRFFFAARFHVEFTMT